MRSEAVLLASAASAALLALVHLFAGKLRFLDVIPRSRWLSMAGGVSVAYVFVHIFPELSREQETIRRLGSFGLRSLEYHVYLMALLGLGVFYGLERLAKESRRRSRVRGEGDATEPGIFWLHIGSFGVYNALIGYLLLHREMRGVRSLLFFAFAMALHFVVNDFGLRQDHKAAYRNVGRWILAAAVFVGWAVGWVTAIHGGVLALLFGFLAGGIVLNVLKEELPEERESRFWAFALGAALYTALLLVT